MKKASHITATILIMLIISRFLIRILDATIQLDNYMCLIWILLIFVNALIGYISYKIGLVITKNRLRKQNPKQR